MDHQPDGAELCAIRRPGKYARRSQSMSAAANSSSPSKFYSALGWLVTLLTPAVLVLTAVRFLMMPAFLTFEYNTPNFPADFYGFTQEDRLYWSNITLEYLLNNAG